MSLKDPPSGTFSNLVRADDCQPDIDQLKQIRDALDRRIELAQTYSTLWSPVQARDIIRLTWAHLVDVGAMFERKLKEPPR